MRERERERERESRALRPLQEASRSCLLFQEEVKKKMQGGKGRKKNQEKQIQKKRQKTLALFGEP